MAIFETFTLLFKTDSAQLKKEVDDVKKKTSETTEVFKDVQDQTKKTDNEFINLSKSLAAVAATYFGAASVIGGFKSSLSQTTNLSQLSKQLDVDIETLDAWGRAVENSGGSAASFQSSLQSLAETFNTSGAVALEYLPKLAEKFQNLTATQAQIYGKRLGLSPDIITFIRQGRLSIESQVEEQKAIGVTTQKDTELAEKYNAATGKLSDSFDDLKRAILEDALPELTKLVEVLTAIVQFFTRNKENDGEVPYKTPSWKEIFSGNVPFIVEKNNKTSSPVEQGKNEQVPLPPIPGYNDTYETPASFNQMPYLPPIIPQVSNSQARSLYVGDVTINTTAQDAKGIGRDIVGQIDNQSEFLNQLQQSNANFDNGVVI
jgi:ASC-1-like (ASCH) protein